MDNKLSELSKPVAWSDERRNLCTNTIKERGLNSKYHQDYEKYSTPIYSQEYVSALQRESAVNWEAAASLNVENQELKNRIAELEAEAKVWESAATKHLERAEEAEKRLATTVRLLGEMLVHDWEHSAERQATFQHRKIAWDARLAEDKKAILAAGFTFTVEGDE